jgi:hypothetical protein
MPTTLRPLGKLLRALLFCGAIIFAISGIYVALRFLPKVSAQRKAAPVRNGSTITVPAGGDFQAALNQAVPGDTIVLMAGATYTGNFLLPAKDAGNEFITIQSSALSDLPNETTRVRPEHSQYMPKLVTTINEPLMKTAPRAHHYRFVGIEFHAARGVYAFDLISLGDSDTTDADLLPSDFEFDRVYVHGDPDKGGKRGFALNSKSTVIKNSYVSDWKSDFQDTQAIGGWIGPGPYLIVNNYLEASGENVMFGGAAPKIPNMVPADIQFYFNHCSRPMSWRGIWRVKNLFELKNARNVDIRYNVFENNWYGAQAGFALQLTVRTCEAGDYPWAVVKDVRFQNNIVRNAEGGAINIGGTDGLREGCVTPGTGRLRSNGSKLMGVGTAFRQQLKRMTLVVAEGESRYVGDVSDDQTATINRPFPKNLEGSAFQYSPLSGQTSELSITDNLFDDIRPLDGSDWGIMVQILSGAKNVVIENNTSFQKRFTITADGDPPSPGLIFRYNLAAHNQSGGIFGSDTQIGKSALERYFPGAIVSTNVLWDPPSWAPDYYPSGNFFPAKIDDVRFQDLAHKNYRLAANSPYRGRGREGRDLGADIDVIERVTARAVDGQPSAAQTEMAIKQFRPSLGPRPASFLKVQKEDKAAAPNERSRSR